MDKLVIGALHNLFGSRAASSLSRDRAGRNNGPNQTFGITNSFATSFRRINDEKNKVASESIFCPYYYSVWTNFESTCVLLLPMTTVAVHIHRWSGACYYQRPRFSKPFHLNYGGANSRCRSFSTSTTRFPCRHTSYYKATTHPIIACH